ncbi:hypothetical protein MRS44_005210 [Fusarium solani]|uniref:uncharacterized protein n=1 Tax=Fusarium solani TaxID=169388 RepID=UPI0032C3E3B9|nr:hypothetical protein MRS44_005210 [Fusarium solani]
MPTTVAPSKIDDDFDFNAATKAVRDGALDLDSAAKTLLSRLDLQERLGLLDGDQDFWPGLYGMSTTGYNRTPYIHGEVKRLGIPGVRFADGPRGCVMGNSTAFPVPMARGASWDVSLEERVGRAIGRECKAQDANFFGGVCVNIPRHPAWGRIQETYGEDPVILGEMGAALTRGIQENVMACVKHYALNSMENARFHVDVKVDEAVLHEVYLAHFRRIVEEGVASVMSSYNSVRGEFAGQNKELLLDILRDQWDFKGFVISDFMFGLRDPALSLRNGLDIEAPFRQQRAWKLEAAYNNGEIDDSHIERAGTNILRRVIEDQVARGNAKLQPDVVFSEEHRQLAREASVKSMVLLKNDEVNGTPALPLKSNISKIAVVGRLANSTDTGDKGSSAVRCPEVVSPYQGLKQALPQADVTLEESEDPEKVKAAAGAADATVVVVGYNFEDEGEFNVPAFETNPAVNSVLPPSDGSEESKWDVEVIKAAVEANPRTIVSIVAAGAVITEEWKNLPLAIALSWYSGCEGGHALADLLLGKVNFSGRLPFSIPTTEKHLPHFDKDAAEIEYDRWFGQRLLDRLDVKAAYPLGFGLSYTSFAVSDLEVEKSKDNPEELAVRVNVSNTGSRAGRYIAQVYGVVEVSDWPKRSLLGFQAVDLDAGEQKKVEIRASARPLQRWKLGSWELVSKTVEVEVGGSSGDAESVRIVIEL